MYPVATAEAQQMMKAPKKISQLVVKDMIVNPKQMKPHPTAMDILCPQISGIFAPSGMKTVYITTIRGIPKKVSLSETSLPKCLR